MRSPKRSPGSFEAAAAKGRSISHMAELVYDNDGRLLFTQEMKREYTLLMPQMLPVHFGMFQKMLQTLLWISSKWVGARKRDLPMMSIITFCRRTTYSISALQATYFALLPP